jgi:hypothetical protein
MSSTSFEPEGSSSGRRLYIQLSSAILYMHQCKQSSRQSSVRYPCTYWTAIRTDACKTYHTISVHNRLPEDEPSGSKLVEDIKKLKIKILI